MPNPQLRAEVPAPAGDGLTQHTDSQLIMTNDDTPELWRLDGVPVLICFPDTKEPDAVIHKPSGACWLTEGDLQIIRAHADTWSPSEREWALLDRARDGEYDAQVSDKEIGPIAYILQQIQSADERRQQHSYTGSDGGDVMSLQRRMARKKAEVVANV